MLYVARDARGQIIEVHPLPLGEAQEAVPTDDPEALRYINERWRASQMSTLDRDFVRVIEDLLEILMAKDIILFTDLPPSVQQKLLKRREVRQLGLFQDNFGTGDQDLIQI